MTRPNIKIYANIPGEHTRGLELHAAAGPYDSSADVYDVQHTWLSALDQGWPGFVRRGAMSIEEAKKYLGTDRTPGQKGSPTRPRDVTVHSVRDGVRELTGLAIYGRSVTEAGMTARTRGESMAHLPVFAVAKETRLGRQLDTEEMHAVGAALSHLLVTDAQTQAYDRLAYKVEASTEEDVNGQLRSLGLLDRIRPEDFDPDFAVRVANTEAVERREVSLDLSEAQTALEGVFTWVVNAEQRQLV